VEDMTAPSPFLVLDREHITHPVHKKCEKMTLKMVKLTQGSEALLKTALRKSEKRCSTRTLLEQKPRPRPRQSTALLSHTKRL
jgi:hypothetical protein